MSDVQCIDLSADRRLGEVWERNFCIIAANYGQTFTAHQIGRSDSARAWRKTGGKFDGIILPDITLWSSDGGHHEIKHKDPSRSGHFGLEEYRFRSLQKFKEITGDDVYYTIHDYSMQPDETRHGRKYNPSNHIDHWLTCEVETLEDHIDRFDLFGTSYVGGKKRDCIPILYWKKETFLPLYTCWKQAIMEHVYTPDEMFEFTGDAYYLTLLESARTG